MNAKRDAEGNLDCNVNKDTARRIAEVAKRLGYRPNKAAASLRSGRFYTIGMVTSDIANQFFADIARYIENIAHNYNYTVLFGSSDENAEKLDNIVDTFIGNGKHKWALSLARDITRRAVFRATHGVLDDAHEAPGLLVLCGPHGTGKTHLIRAVGNELFRTLGSDLYSASLSDLELLYAERSVLAVRQELFAKEAVLIDDFQHLSRIPDKTPTTTASRFRAPLAAEPETPAGPSLREELCLLLDRFMDQGKPVVVAGVGRPKDWNLGKALLSRLETGLWAELPEPDLDVRVRYAQQQAKLRRLPLPREQLLLIAQHCPDIRRLSGVIRRVSSHRSLLGRDLSEQDLLNIVRQGGDSSALTPQLIVSIVGEHCGVPAKEILGEKRRPDLVQARQLAMYLCRELLGHSYPVIGRMFGGKDHSTVMHGVKKIKLLQERDRLAHSMVTELTKACLEHRG